jgi:hypothetical protein
LVQREYVRSWVAQGEFWKDVVASCPDIRPGTVILYPLVGQVSPMVRDQEWADYLVFGHMFVCPDPATAPKAFGVAHNSSTPAGEYYAGYHWHEIERDGDRWFWKHWDGSRHELEPGNIILMRYSHKTRRFERMTGTIHVAGSELALKPRGEPTFEFAPHKLFFAMFPQGLQPDLRRRLPR